MDFEAKLAEYRANRHRKYLEENTKKKSYNFFGFGSMESPDTDGIQESQEQIDARLENESLFSNRRKTYKIIGLSILWTAAFFVFVKLQWGAVFFIMSALIFIYFNTRTGPKKTGEVSAYSVFNPDCKNIDGTLTAEQFEKELRYGPGTV